MGPGATLVCRITAANAMGTVQPAAGLALPTPSVGVRPTGAYPATATAIPVGTVLTCSVVSGTPGTSSSYRWARLSSPQSAVGSGFPAGSSVVAGQVAATYTTTSADSGRYPACEEVAASWAGATASFGTAALKGASS